MTRTIVGRPPLGFLWLILILAAGAASLPLLDQLRSKSRPAQTLLRDLSRGRPAGARLFHSPSSDTKDPEYQSRLAQAQMAVLSMPESVLRQKIQSLIHIGTGNWQKAADILANLAAAEPKDPEILNDLGVVYIALGEQNAIYYFKALQL